MLNVFNLRLTKGTRMNLLHGFRTVLCFGLSVLIGGGPTLSYAAVVNWVPDADGNWNTATNWSSNPVLPLAGDDVTINVAGVRTITHNSGTHTIQSLSLSEILALSGGILEVTGTTTLNAGGSIQLSGGTLKNTTVQQNGANKLTFNSSGSNILDNVLVKGDLDLSGTSNRVTFLNNTVVQTEAGGTPGVINVTGQSAILSYDGTAGWARTLSEYDDQPGQ